ncbi:MAG: 4Fe-4S binding protein [Firmicutes bacterium]|nr:4Fe-4S binding protein [Bacillota bacterium]
MKVTEKCVGCGACVSVCPFGAIDIVEKEDGTVEAVIDQDVCVGCGGCANVCPAEAIENK